MTPNAESVRVIDVLTESLYATEDPELLMWEWAELLAAELKRRGWALSPMNSSGATE